ncbi:ProC [Planktothrix rubescens]|nr:ProC [Planktothrix rubescens]
MPTTFENIKLKEDGTEGQIITISTFYVWDCTNQRFSTSPPVVLRNTMLAALYPAKEFIIGEIPKTSSNPSLLDPFKVPAVSDPYFLDLASNSRTHGRFLFTPKRTIGRDYFPKKDDWKRIIYGSILHTGCNRMFYREIKYIVVDDERRNPSDSSPQDDGVNNTHWDTGDCHAKLSKSLLTLLESWETIGNEDNPTTIQIRAAIFKEWTIKGTASHSYKFETDPRFAGVDLVIPLSCFKGNKPAPGNYTGKVLIGVVHEAEERRAKPGWMLWQWFSFETLEEDGIISKLHEKCQKLSSALDDIYKLADVLRIDLDEAEQELANLDDNPDAEVAYVDSVLKIIKADKKGVLILHPYVLLKVKFRLREMWKNLAKSAGVRFYSVMCTPDTSLEKYQKPYGNDFVFKPKVFCSPSFNEGQYIVFCNPMRHWGDVQLWENFHEGRFRNTRGVLAATRELLLSLGRDTDGDFIQLINSSRYPNLTMALYDMDAPPKVKKFPKVALTGSLQQIAINSMNDITGVVASLLGRARAIGAELIVLDIPKEGEMRIIDFLSQELQIAVDSLKSAYPNNQDGLKVVKEFLDKSGADIQWLADLKSDDCYFTRPCLVNNNLTDTVTRIVSLVNSYYRQPNLREDTIPMDYRFTLFSLVVSDAVQDAIALRERDAYRAEMGAALAHKAANDDDRLVKEVTAKFKVQTEVIMRETLNPLRKPYPPKTWAAAYWRVNHLAKSGTAGLVFLLFCDEIIEELKRMESKKVWIVVLYAVQYTAFARPQSNAWNGEELTVRSSFLNVNGKDKVSLEGKLDGQPGFINMGLVNEKDISQVPNGWTGRVKIYAKTYENDKYPRKMSPNDVCTSLYCFSVDMEQSDIDDFMNDHWSNHSRFNPL